MKSQSEPNELTPQTIDYVASAARSVIGAVPFVGSLLIELAEIIIPNLRIDRIADFAERLHLRIAHLENSQVQKELEDESFTDLLEDGMRQAARSLSEERREYIAGIIANSLSQDEVSYIESKHLLSLLGELNDIEVVWLRFYLVSTLGGDDEFRSQHDNILEPVMATFNDPQSVQDREAIQDSYKQHLSRLGLLQPRYRTDMETRLPEFDSFSGAQETEGYVITSLGRLLLRFIGLSVE